MKWILIFVLTGEASHAYHIEFRSEAACLAAETQLEAEDAKNGLFWRIAFAFCVDDGGE